jgi:hypothetical protein
MSCFLFGFRLTENMSGKRETFWHAACNRDGKHQKDALKKYKEEIIMGLLRGGVAAAGAWKLGGGLISTILIFILLYWLLGFFMN